MAKAKAKVPKANPASSRVQFLHQAAALLAQQHATSTCLLETIESSNTTTQQRPAQALQPLSRRLVSDLRAVSLKAQVRLAPAVKHSFCKSCNTVLIEGSTCSKELENRSKGRKKPWADMMVQKCNTCGVAKRFPLAAARQKRNPHRAAKTGEEVPAAEVDKDVDP